MKEKTRNILLLITYMAGVLFGTYVSVSLHSAIVVLPLPLRMIAFFADYWLVFLVLFVFVEFSHERFAFGGFSKEKVPKQILLGIGAGLAMSLIFTCIPHIAGFGSFVSGGKEYKFLWQFIYEFVYMTGAVAAVEEMVFRGYFYDRIEKLWGNSAAVWLSSAMFGIFHIFGGNIIQIFLTFLIGLLFCAMRRIKDFSLLSLILMHGVYDAMISVWDYVF